jgi:hypothetical protein
VHKQADKKYGNDIRNSGLHHFAYINAYERATGDILSAGYGNVI